MIGAAKLKFLGNLYGNNLLLKEQGFVEKVFSAPEWDKSNWIQSAYWNYEIRSGRLLNAYKKKTS